MFGQKSVILIAGTRSEAEWPLEEVVLAGRKVGFFEDGAEGCVTAGGGVDLRGRATGLGVLSASGEGFGL